MSQPGCFARGLLGRDLFLQGTPPEVACIVFVHGFRFQRAMSSGKGASASIVRVTPPNTNSPMRL